MFEPGWTLQIGTNVISGNGILGKRRPPDDLIEVFSVTLNGTQLIVLPKEGRILKNLVTVLVVKPGRLIWGRTIHLIIGDGAPKTRCHRYFIGIENGERHGFRIDQDGKVESGL